MQVGINSVLRQLPDTVGQAEIEAVVRELCEDATIDGILVQLPLPPHLDEESIIESFDPAKDVDGFHPLNVGRILMRGRAPTFVPCTALGCMELLMRSGVDVRGKKAVILVRSRVYLQALALSSCMSLPRWHSHQLIGRPFLAQCEGWVIGYISSTALLNCPIICQCGDVGKGNMEQVCVSWTQCPRRCQGL